MKSQLTGKTLMLGKIEDKRKRRRQRKRWLESITDSMDMNLNKLWEIVEDRGGWHACFNIPLLGKRLVKCILIPFLPSN